MQGSVLDLKQVTDHNANELVVEDATGAVQVLGGSKRFLFALVSDSKGQEHELFVKSGVDKNDEDKYFDTRSWDPKKKEMARKNHGIAVPRPKKAGRRKEIDPNSLYHQLQKKLGFSENATKVTLVKLRKGFSRLRSFRQLQIQVLRDEGAVLSQKQQACDLLLRGYEFERNQAVAQLLGVLRQEFNHDTLNSLLDVIDPAGGAELEVQESVSELDLCLESEETNLSVSLDDDDNSLFSSSAAINFGPELSLFDLDLFSLLDEPLLRFLRSISSEHLFESATELLLACQSVLEAEKELSDDLALGFPIELDRMILSPDGDILKADFRGNMEHLERRWCKVHEVKMRRCKMEVLASAMRNDVFQFIVHDLVWTIDDMQNKMLEKIHMSALEGYDFWIAPLKA